MTVDWASFTPWSALIGGLITGLAAPMLAAVNGRVAGISGIIGGDASSDHRRIRLPDNGDRWTVGRHRHALWRRLYQWPRRLRPFAIVAALGGRDGWARKRSVTLLGTPMLLPQTGAVGRRLIGGSLLQAPLPTPTAASE